MRVLRLMVLVVMVLLVAVPRPGDSAPGAPVAVIRLSGMINPGSAGFLERGLAEAKEMGAQCLVVELNTPGGLVTSLRRMVQDILESSIPVVVYVWPSGGQAASAGALLTMAAHVAAMAPGTNIGAAHPVGPGLGSKNATILGKKVENDLAALARGIAAERGRNVEWAQKAVVESLSATAREAERLGVIDMVAGDLQALLAALEGRTIVLKDGKRVLHTAAARVVEIEERPLERFLQLLGDPNIAYLLLMVGVTGLYFELAHPGAIFPGVAGAISLILGLYGLDSLPLNLTGILLLLLGLVLFVLELFITSHGILGLAGLVALVLGSVMLFDPSGLVGGFDLGVVWGAATIFGLALLALSYLAARAVLARPRAGREAMVGATGRAVSDVDEDGGRVFVPGELWNATCEGRIPEGKKVVVTGVEGMRLVVRAAEGEER